MAFSCNISSISRAWQLRLLGIVLLVVGIIDYLVDVVENYIIGMLLINYTFILLKIFIYFFL